MRHLPGLLLAAAGLSGCNADTPVDPELPRPRVAASLTVVSGDFQQAFLGTPLPDSIRVVVMDRLGRPVPRSPVQFVPSSPTAKAFPSGFILTDSLGQVTASWYLGDEASPQWLTAMVPGGPSVEVHALAFDSLKASVTTAHTGRIQTDDPEPPPTFSYQQNVLRIERDFISNNAPHSAEVAALWSGDTLWVEIRTMSGPFPAYSIGRYTALIELPMRPLPRHVVLRNTIHAVRGSSFTAPVYFDLP